jgi:superfamily II DNA or RNA helicase
MMDGGKIDFIIVVAPSDNLRTQWVKELGELEMAGFSAQAARELLNGDELKVTLNHIQARVYTFQGLKQYTSEIKKIVKERKVLLIVDEVHHAGDALPWAQSMEAALKGAQFKLVLSGTPWRSDSRTMPFVNYDTHGNAIPDYAYMRSDALRDGGVVRRAVFVPIDAQVEGEVIVERRHPETGETLKITTTKIDGRVSKWEYGREVAATDRLVDPERLTNMVLMGSEPRGLSDEEITEKIRASGLEGVKTKPEETTRLVWEGGKTVRRYYLMHKETPDTKRVYRSALDTHQSQAVRLMFEEAHKKLQWLRNPENPFVDTTAGGLVVAENKAAARRIVDIIEDLTGTKPRLVLSDIEKAGDQIKGFRESNEEWIVTVKMVSEGVDIKRLRVLTYMSNVMSELFIAQVLGRITRYRSDLPSEQTAYFYMLAYPPLMDMARLVDDNVLTQPSMPMSLPAVPLVPLVCSPISKEGAGQKQLSCSHINSPMASRCSHCGWPLKMGTERNVQVDTDDMQMAGALTQGIYAEQSFVNDAGTAIKEDPFLLGFSEELLGVVFKRVKDRLMRQEILEAMKKQRGVAA